MIVIRVPGTLAYRELTVRAVAAACKLVTDDGGGRDDGALREFGDHVVSAFSEAFNNVAIHSFRDRAVGPLEIEIELGADFLTIRMKDGGISFDLSTVPEPNLDELPESGLGIFIIKSFMDEVAYQAGAPNVLTMTKHLRPAGPEGGGR